MNKRETESILRDWHLERLRITGNTITRSLRGIQKFLLHPVVGLDFLARILASSWRNPGHLVKSLLLLPRAIDTFFEIPSDKAGVVHLFWGHYPSLVGYLFLRWRKDCVVSIFLGAYDLLSRYDLSVYVANRADVVWTHTRANLKALAELGVVNEMLRVSHRGIDLSSVPDHRKKVLRRIVTAGRLIRDKNMHEVLRVFSMVHKQWADATLVVIGDGPELENLKALAGELGIGGAVTFTGYLNQSYVYAEMSVAEVFLLLSTSRSERLPNVVKEASACGCPCIVGNTPGIDELITNGSNGFIVSNDRIGESVRYTDMLFRSREAMQGIGRRAEQRVIDRFDASRLVAERIQVWQLSISEYDKLPQIFDDFLEDIERIGPNPYKSL